MNQIPDNLQQAYVMHQYNDLYREQFNQDLFNRDDYGIIEELKKVILSTQRDGVFKIRVDGFDVIEEYYDVMTVLKNYEDDMYRNKKKKRDNVYDFIDIKDSDVRVLRVHYHIEAQGSEEDVTVLIAVPRIVNKYYFRISGNYYIAMMQVVDGSTYNNSTSTGAKKASITLKNIFMPIRINRSEWVLNTIDGEQIKCTAYYSRIFSKSFNAIKYILAKFGLMQTMSFLGIYDVQISNVPIRDDRYYCFKRHEDVDIFVSVPKYLYNNSEIVQSFVHALWVSIPTAKFANYYAMFDNRFWVWSLSGEFGSAIVEKGYSILTSVEGIYDIKTMETIKLPIEEKCSVYHIIRWMIREFDNIKSKDNLDVSIKRVRISEYIASLYAYKLNTGTYRISDNSNRTNVDSIRKVIVIDPLYLLKAITKCNLVNYRDLVNDLDPIMALKYTYKGISGIGDSSGKMVPDVYKYANYTQLGIMDLDSSSKSDPGMSGMLCPMAKIYGDSFSEYEEPNEWINKYTETQKVMDELFPKVDLIKFAPDLIKFNEKKPKKKKEEGEIDGGELL